MWIILSCLEICGLEQMRAAGWAAEQAYSFRAYESDRLRWSRDGEEQFASQRECLRHIRIENPERDQAEHGAVNEAWGFLHVTHHPDYIETHEGGGMRQGAGMMAHSYQACFEENDKRSKHRQ